MKRIGYASGARRDCPIYGFYPALPAFLADNPSIVVELRSTDFEPDLARGEANADIRFFGDWEPGPTKSIVQVVDLFRPKVIPVVSPGFLKGISPLSSPGDMLRLPLLHEEGEEKWRAWCDRQGVAVSGHIAGLRLWHAHLTIEAARRGQGVALAHHLLVKDQIRNYELVELEVGARTRVSFGKYVMTARKDRWKTPALTLFRDWLHGAIKEGLLR